MSIADLCSACLSGDNNRVKTILASGRVDINSYHCGGVYTPLMCAMLKNHPTIVTTLLSHTDCRLDCTHRVTGVTGLHWACGNNSQSVISIFGQDRRCSPSVLNIKDNDGETAVMCAVDRGHLDCVKEMAKLEGTDFGTKNEKGETLIEVARRLKHTLVLQFLQDRNTQVATYVATNTLGGLRLRDIAEELDNLEEMEAAMASENAIMKARHEEEIARRSAEQKTKLDDFVEEQKQELGNIKNKQREELEELDRMMMENKRKKNALQIKMQSRLNPSASPAPSPDVPECPVCLEEMKPPTQIFNCPNGHLICAVCRPKVAVCTNCRKEYMGRATAVEQILRQMFGCQ